MTIRIGTNKTVVNGVRGREIISIKALSKKKLPADYLSWDGAVYREVLPDGKGVCLYVLGKTSGPVKQSGIMLPNVFFKDRMVDLRKEVPGEESRVYSSR